jgi:hypothetical protein
MWRPRPLRSCILPVIKIYLLEKESINHVVTRYEKEGFFLKMQRFKTVDWRFRTYTRLSIRRVLLEL